MDDLAQLEGLTEETLNKALRDRYQQDKIYTYIGDILVAINPFQTLPRLYDAQATRLYTAVESAAAVPPHLFAVAERAYRSAVRNQKSQVCVISGESGAGKTQSANLFVSHVMTISQQGVAVAASDTSIEAKILQASPILEAFGNARTLMNDNSSRFGKYTELKIQNGSVVGASLSHYLLEKSRVVSQPEGEQNYHVFEYLLSGLGATMKTALHLAGREFRYINNNEAFTPESAQRWADLMNAMNLVGIASADQNDILVVLATVLHAGNMDFAERSNETNSFVSTLEPLRHCCELLMLDEAQLIRALTVQVFDVRGEKVEKHLPPEGCVWVRDAMAKALYERLFVWLVQRLDELLRAKANESSMVAIGILDIFGFELFEENGFEQLCINLANEELQFFFNEHIFSLELKEYQAEGVPTLDIEFTSNKDVLDLFFAKPLGLLKLLNEESRFPNATHASLITKLTEHLSKKPKFAKVPGQDAFVVHHYAGPVEYNSDQFIELNRDPLPNMVIETLASSRVTLVRTLFGAGFFKEFGEVGTSFRLLNVFRSRRKTSKSEEKPVVEKHKRRKRSSQVQQDTVSDQFKKSLGLLIEKMGRCEPHFVRCVKPNEDRAPNQYDEEFVKKQLRYTGMLETTRIRREGYSHRITFKDFVARYKCIAFDVSDRSVHDNKDTCVAILKRAKELMSHQQDLLDKFDQYRCGKTKMFLRFWHVEALGLLLDRITGAAAKIQALVRMVQARGKFKALLGHYRQQEQDKTVFLMDIGHQSRRIFNMLQTLVDEDDRRAPEVLAEAPSKPTGGKAHGKHIPQKDLHKEITKGRKAIIKWWNKFERMKGLHCDDEGRIYPWFHGLVSRFEAEEMLHNKPPGTYLVRVSERYEGYAISFCYKNRVRHYKLGHADNVGHWVIGNKDDFPTLIELLDYYQVMPLSRRDEDTLGEPLDKKHDLGLGISSEIGEDFVDRAAAKALRSNKANGAPEVPRRTNRQGQQLAGMRRSGSVVSLVAMSAEEMMGQPIPESFFLAPGPRPDWLRGEISRMQAENELLLRGRVEGSFVVRLKVHSSQRVTHAISFVRDAKFRHHLIEFNDKGEWSLDEVPLIDTGYMQDVIGRLQREPVLGIRLNAAMTSFEIGAQRRTLAHHTDKWICAEWSVDQVAAWLDSIKQQHNREKFRQRNINGRALCQLTSDTMEKFIESPKDIGFIFAAIQTLQGSAEHPPEVPARRRLSREYPAVSEAELASRRVSGDWGAFNEAASKRSSMHTLDSSSALPVFVPSGGDAPPLPWRPSLAAPASNANTLMPRRDPTDFYTPGGVFGKDPIEHQLRKLAKAGNRRRIGDFLEQHPELRINAVPFGGSGKTALYLAAERGFVEVVNLLMDYGADPFRRDNNGISPLQAAQANNEQLVVIALKSAMQRISTEGPRQYVTPRRLSAGTHGTLMGTPSSSTLVTSTLMGTPSSSTLVTSTPSRESQQLQQEQAEELARLPRYIEMLSDGPPPPEDWGDARPLSAQEGIYDVDGSQEGPTVLSW